MVLKFQLSKVLTFQAGIDVDQSLYKSANIVCLQHQINQACGLIFIQLSQLPSNDINSVLFTPIMPGHGSMGSFAMMLQCYGG